MTVVSILFRYIKSNITNIILNVLYTNSTIFKMCKILCNDVCVKQKKKNYRVLSDITIIDLFCMPK